MQHDYAAPERLTKHDWTGPGGWHLLAPAPAMAGVVFGVLVAHHQDQDGPLDDIASDNLLLPHGLDGPIPWIYDDEHTTAETVELCARARDRALETLRLNNLPVPRTPREFAGLLACLGLLEHTTTPERWRVPHDGPPPLEEALALPAAVHAELQRQRQRYAEEEEIERHWKEAQL